MNIPGGNLVSQSGMQLNMQAKTNSSKSCSVREGRKLNMAITMDDLAGLTTTAISGGQLGTIGRG